tara:strand:+ start:198 stop:695 length:498 start_codon:yes stop_codon:yes gene_type:complete
MAHRLLSGHSKKCAIPHGHNEFVRISLGCLNAPALNKKDNMVTDFASAKALWHTFIDDHLDHSFQLRSDDPLLPYFKENEPEQLARIVITPGDPTTEMLCACLMSKLDLLLQSTDSPLVCHRFELEETPTNTVVLSGIKVYQAHLPKGDHWWNRGDFSINDFKSR